MVHQRLQSRALAGAGPFQHLAIAGRVVEGSVGALANEQIDPDRLTRMVVVKEQFGKPSELRLTIT
jgi:hypothetical protein